MASRSGATGEHGAQALINPHDLYHERWLSALAEARTALAAAQLSVRATKQRDADAAARSIWEGSEK